MKNYKGYESELKELREHQRNLSKLISHLNRRENYLVKRILGELNKKEDL